MSSYEETIDDLLDLTEGMANTLSTAAACHDITLVEYMGLGGLSGLTLPKEVTDEMGMVDDFSIGWLKELDDAIGMDDSPAFSFLKIITDTLFGYDNANVGWNLTATETLDLAETLDVALGLIIDEWLTVIGILKYWAGKTVNGQGIVKRYIIGA